MHRSFRALNVRSYRVASPLAGLALLACCLGQTCNLNPLPDTNVLASTPDTPDASSDSTSDTVEPYEEPVDDATAAKRMNGQQIDRIIDANERDTITVDYSSLRGSRKTFTWKQISGPIVTIRPTAVAVAAVSLPSVNTDVTVILDLVVSTNHGSTEYFIQINVHDLDALVADTTFQSTTTSGAEPLTVGFTVIRSSGAAVADGTYAWQFGDGSVAGGTSVNHTFNAGSWSVNLCSTFGSGLATATGCKTATITVLSPSAKAANHRISGRVHTNGVGLAGATITGGSGVSSVTSDGAGGYTLTVPDGWSGSVTAQMNDFAMTPGSLAVVTVAADVSGEDFQAIPLSQLNLAPNSYYVDPNGNDNWSGGLPSPNSAGTDGPFLTSFKATSVAHAGDTVYFRGGTYTPVYQGNYRACLEINSSGANGAPITFRNFPGENPIFDAQDATTYTIRVGNPFIETGVSYIVLDGLSATGADRNGVYTWRSSNIIVRNCRVYSNNQSFATGGWTAYYAGVELDGGDAITVERCRVWDNGYGIESYELDIGSTDPVGTTNTIVRDNFVWGNSSSGNVGNSAGIGFRFGTRCTIDGNILWDNPDAGINGLGNSFCRVTRNICFNNWQAPGNMEGIKLCVRGGGCNLLAGNICAYNGNTGFDACDGIGDILINNTFYANGGWGLLMEGLQTALFNNITHLNDPTNNGYRDLEIPGIDGVPFAMYSSDYNLLGQERLPFWFGSMTHSLNGDPQLTNPAMTPVRNTLRQQLSPEQLFVDANHDGIVTIEEARADLAGRFAPLSSSKVRGVGLKLTSVRTNVLAVIPEMITNLQTRALQRQNDPNTNFQWLQSASRYLRLVTELNSSNHGGYGDLSGVTDIFGNAIPQDGAPTLGAVQ